MRGGIGWLICGLWMAAPCAAEELRLLECRGPAGERVFVDRRQCPSGSTAIAERLLPAPPPAPEPVRAKAEEKPARARPGSGASRTRATREPPMAYACRIGEALWYQFQPCRDGVSKDGRNDVGAVRQERVSRAHACREMNRAGALLRRGSERDQRAGPYARAQGKDPCA